MTELGRPLHLLSDAVRGFLWAAPGHELVVADFSSIEGRLAAWIADERWKIDAMILNDRGEGPGMYELAAAGIYDVEPAAVDKAQRQVGKVAELALGYQGGVGAFYTMSRGYGLKLESAYPSVWASASAERREAATDRYDECAERNDRTAKLLSREAWLAAELVKVGWRATHPRIAAAWKDLNAAAKDAVETPGVQTTTLGGRVSYVVRRGFLWCRLPGGRCLAYGAPAVREIEAPWANPEDPPARRDKVRSVTALGVNSVTKKFERYPLYGGLLFENLVQAAARDLLANGILKAEAAGYPVIGHVHDEIIAEVPRGTGDAKAFEEIICDLPEWASGLPLRAAGWKGKRYRKA